MPMSRLFYTSRSAMTPAGPRAQSIGRIAADGAERNRAAGLTGALFAIDRDFVQILEGPHEQVESTFERICCDFRHRELKLVDLVLTGERLFAPWDLAFVTADAGSPVYSELEQIRFLLSVNARSAVGQMRQLAAALY